MEKVKCDYCNSEYYSIFFNGYNFNKDKNNEINLVICNKCGLTYINPRPDKNEIKKYYDEYYNNKDNIEFKGLAKKIMYLRRYMRAKRIVEIKNSGRILDIGCGKGIFLNYMRKFGWDVFGIEISPIVIKYAKENFNLDILMGSLEEHKFSSHFFDVITLYDVLEHLPHPFHTLKEIYRILKPDGLLVFSVPNIYSWQAKIFKTKWVHLDIPRHFFLFNREFLFKMLNTEKQWNIIKVKNFSFNDIFGWIQSILNCIFPAENIFSNIMKSNKISSISIYSKIQFKIYHLVKVTVNLILWFFLFVPVLFLSILSSFARQNAILELYCKK